MTWVPLDARDRFFAIATFKAYGHFTVFQFVMFNESVVALHVLGSDAKMAGMYIAGFHRHFDDAR